MIEGEGHNPSQEARDIADWIDEQVRYAIRANVLLDNILPHNLQPRKERQAAVSESNPEISKQVAEAYLGVTDSINKFFGFAITPETIPMPFNVLGLKGKLNVSFMNFGGQRYIHIIHSFRKSGYENGKRVFGDIKEEFTLFSNGTAQYISSRTEPGSTAKVLSGAEAGKVCITFVEKFVTAVDNPEHSPQALLERSKNNIYPNIVESLDRLGLVLDKDAPPFNKKPSIRKRLEGLFRHHNSKVVEISGLGEYFVRYLPLIDSQEGVIIHFTAVEDGKKNIPSISSDGTIIGYTTSLTDKGSSRLSCQEAYKQARDLKKVLSASCY